LAAALLALKPRASNAAASRLPFHVKFFRIPNHFFSALIEVLDV